MLLTWNFFLCCLRRGFWTDCIIAPHNNQVEKYDRLGTTRAVQHPKHWEIYVHAKPGPHPPFVIFGPLGGRGVCEPLNDYTSTIVHAQSKSLDPSLSEANHLMF